MIRHLVFLKYAPDVSGDVKDSILKDLNNLKSEIEGILAFGNRPNLSPEDDVIHGFKDMFWFDFKDVATRDAYLENETHKAIGVRIVNAAEGGPEGVFVCDIEL